MLTSAAYKRCAKENRLAIWDEEQKNPKPFVKILLLFLCHVAGQEWQDPCGMASPSAQEHSHAGTDADGETCTSSSHLIKVEE